MTTRDFHEKVCALCGKASRQEIIYSTNSFGSMDLDTRPPEMKRSTIDTDIQRCPHCGYCSPDISTLKENATQIVNSDVYRAQLDHSDFPPLANAFLCYALIEEKNWNVTEAAWGCIYASWACDDAKTTEAAISCRNKALALLEKETDLISGDRYALRIDLLRRAERFDEALALSHEALDQELKDIIQKIIRYEQQLIAAADSACHNVKEVFPQEYKKKYIIPLSAFLLDNEEPEQ